MTGTAGGGGTVGDAVVPDVPAMAPCGDGGADVTGVLILGMSRGALVFQK